MQHRLRAGQPIERLYGDARLELARGRPPTVQHLTIVRELLDGHVGVSSAQSGVGGGPVNQPTQLVVVSAFRA